PGADVPAPWPLDGPATRGHDPRGRGPVDPDDIAARFDLGPDDDPPPAPYEQDDPPRGRAAGPGPRGPVAGRWWTVPLAALLLLGWVSSVFVDVGGLLGVLPVTLATTAPFVTVLAVPVATLAVRRRRWESLVAALVAGALPWAFVLGYASADPPPADAGAAVTVLVVNAHDGRADAAEIVAAVRSHDVDVLVVTELSRTLTHELTEARLATFLAPQWFDVEDAPDEGLGVWSRLDLAGTALVPGTTWPAVSLQVQTRAGDLTVVAGHVVPPVPSDVDDWRSDLEALGAAVRGKERTLLAGSFNASPWHAQYRRLLGTTLVDAADVQGAGLRPTWPAWTPLPLVPLDSALVTKDLRVVSADTVPVQDTDHRALLVSLEVPGDLRSGD
ncbi:endonuclease/exonuclease/phosphatase family protein, partial [Kineosporia sp. R_H_3]|uniref:endonuclease/exonuclease/phosphatase family protein n=1 Tax=Kineosporia sp. R_H_3 TaxID=1961848 RepID=UPI001E428582